MKLHPVRGATPAIRVFVPILLPALAVLALTLSARAPASAQEIAWQEAAVPEVWSRPPAGIVAEGAGFGWFRCRVRVPESWQGRPWKLYVEAADDARQYFVNGRQVGVMGDFPPRFRSGLGEEQRYDVPVEATRGEQAVVAIRLYMKESRGNFNVAAPVLFLGDQAIRLAGKWELHIGDLEPAQSSTGVAGEEFGRTLPASEAEALLKRLPGEEGPLSVADALLKMQVADDLEVDVPLADPDIGQPLQISFDQRGRLWVAEYRQYPNPAGLKMLSRDKFLRSVYDKVPPPPPHHFRGLDRISIHEDADGDGRFERHKVFVEGLSLASSLAVGHGGVFILNPPYLLFYPDKDGDDVPDGDPEVLLEGFGIEDSHSVTNSLTWGPDGWLYATQGSTVTGSVRRPGEKTPPIHSMGQLVWRYHPTTRAYEVFAEGGGNAFGVEIDAHGRIFSGHNGGDTRGFHYVQGAYLQKGFGKHGELSNPYAFGYFAQMAHNNVPRFTHTFVIYEGDALPERYRGGVLGVAPLLSHVVHSRMFPDRSSFQTKDEGHPLQSKDPWFRPVDIKVGPDGAVYVADFYEQRIDHASHYQGRVDRESGRIYRLRAKGARAGYEPFDLGAAPTSELVAALRHPNKWWRQTALRVLDDRQDQSALPASRQMLAEETGLPALEALWALHLLTGLDEREAAPLLEHADPFVRLWTTRLLCDDRKVSDDIAQRLASQATREVDVQARSQLACSARRLPLAQGQPIVRNLLTHAEDVGDIHVPLLLWWAIETETTENAERALELLREPAVWRLPMVREHLLERWMRRLALGSRRELTLSAELLELAPDEDAVSRLMKGLDEAFQGRQATGLPERLLAALAKHGKASLALRVRQRDAEALDEALRKLADTQTPAAERRLLAEVLGQVGEPRAVEPLLSIARAQGDAGVREAALVALQAFNEPRIGERVLEMLGELPDDVRAVAQSLLASRLTWTRQYLDAVGSGKLPPDAVPLPVVRRLLLHQDDEVARRVERHWGQVAGATSEQMLALIAQYKEWIAAGSGNPYNGKKLFASNCGKCHTLFNEGGRIGPDLTAYKRDDLHNVLLNVVNPSIEIREGYENTVIQTEDGLRINGFVQEQDNQVVVLKRPDGQLTVIPRDEIEVMRAVPMSIMPEGALQSFTEQEVRDLFAYLRATQPLN